MKQLAGFQLRQLELLQEKQKIINELKELEVSSTVSFVIPIEVNIDMHKHFHGEENIFSWLENVNIISSTSESVMPIDLIDSVFNNISVSLAIEDSNPWIQSFFKNNFSVKAKINVVEKARFKIFTS